MKNYKSWVLKVTIKKKKSRKKKKKQEEEAVPTGCQHVRNPAHMY